MDLSIVFALPLIFASIFAVILPLFDAIVKEKKGLIFYGTIGGILILFLMNFYLMGLSEFWNGQLNINQKLGFGYIIKNSIVLGSYTVIFDLFFALGALLVIIASRQFLIKENYEIKEFYSLMVFSLLGMMFIVHSNSLLVLFLGIELMSIPFFVLSGFFRNRLSSIEASVKYFLLGAFATGFLVFGIAFIYGATGSIELNIIKSHILSNQFNPVYLSIGISLIFVGLAFKASTFPFHQWAPDVYTGAPTIVTSFMSTVGKTASFAAFIIIAKSIIPQISEINLSLISASITAYSREILAVVSALTMIVGNISALVQSNVKRMLAFSSVAHAGYILIGIVSNTATGWSGIVFYTGAYILMQIGAFIIVSLIEGDDDKMLNIEDYNGLSKSNPYLAFAMSIFMFSLVGLPPFGGFFGKYYLFLSAIESGFLWLTVIAVIASLISIYFYIGLVINMYFKDQKIEQGKVTLGFANISVMISLIGIILLGIFPDFLNQLSIHIFK